MTIRLGANELIVALLTLAGCSADAADSRPEFMPTSLEGNAIPGSTLLPASERRPLGSRALLVTTHSERQVSLGELLDRPTAITFFYTRCDNPNKCACTVGRFGALRRELIKRKIADQTRLLVFTFEPIFDTPEKLRSYAKSFDLELDDNTLMLRADPQDLQQLLKELDIPVSYSDDWVTLHGMCVYLVDSRGCISLAQRDGFWEPEHLTQQLETMLRERRE